MALAGSYYAVSCGAHLNFIADYREAFGEDCLGAVGILNKAADAWQGLTHAQRKKFELKQYLEARDAELKRVKSGESKDMVWIEQKEAFRKLALRGQAKYRAKCELVEWKSGNSFEGAYGAQLKANNVSLFKYKSCLCSILGFLLGFCRSKRQAAI